MRHSMFMIEECIENHDMQLTNTKKTTIVLRKGGDDFFKAHIEDKERYKRLVDIYYSFIHKTVSKVREVGFNKTGDRLNQNKPQIKQFLKQNNWTRAFMTDHEWVKDKNDNYVFGHMQNGELYKTKGILIFYSGTVYITCFDRHGCFDERRPLFECDESGIKQ
jgi:hypothetical protein